MSFAELSSKNIKQTNLAIAMNTVKQIDPVSFGSFFSWKTAIVESEAFGVLTSSLELTYVPPENRTSLNVNEWTQLGKTIYFRLSTYTNPIFVVQKIYLSKSYLVYNKDFNTGDTVSFEPRINSISSFNREIDFIDNKTTINGKLTITLNNKDKGLDYLNTFFLKNQKCEVYSLIKDEDMLREVDPNDTSGSLLKFWENKKIGVFTINEISFEDDTIKINCEENNPLRNQLSNKITKTENSFFLFGNVKKLEFNTEYTDFDEYVYTGLNVELSSTINGTFLTYFSDPLLLLRTLMIGNRFALGSTSTDTIIEFWQGKRTINGTDNFLRTNLPIIVGLTATFKLYINKEDYQNLYSNINITDKWTKEEVDYIQTTPFSPIDFISQGSRVFKINDDFNFLQPKDLIILRGNFSTSVSSISEQELEVVSYNASTKEITVKAGLHDDFWINSNSSVRYPRIKQVILNEKNKFINKKTNSIIQMGAYATLPGSGASAYFILEYEGTRYSFWFKKLSSTNPSIAGTTPIEVLVVPSSTDDDYYNSIKTAIISNGLGNKFLISRTATSNEFSIQWVNYPVVLPFISFPGGYSGFSLSYEDSLNVGKNFQATFSNTNGVSIEFNKENLAANNQSGFLFSAVGNLTIATVDSKRRVISTVNNIFKDVKAGDYIYIPAFSATPLFITEVGDDPVSGKSACIVWIANTIPATTTITTEWRIFKGFEFSKDLKIEYSGVFTLPHYSNIVKDVLNGCYNITNINQASLDSIKTNFPFLNFGLIVEKENTIADCLNKLNQSSNLVVFTNTSGQFDFKFFNLSSLPTEVDTVDFYSVFNFKRTIISNNKISINFKWDYNNTLSKYDVEDTILNPDDFLVTLLNIRETVDVSSLFFIQENKTSNEQHLKDKFFKNVEQVDINGSLSFLNYELGDCIKLSNFKDIDSSYKYIITQIKTNGQECSVRCIRFI